MAYVDIAFLAILAISMIIGFSRGFFKSLATLLGSLVCLIAAVVVTIFTVDQVLAVETINGWFYGETGSLASAIKGGIFSSPSEQLATLTVAQAAADPSLLGEALGGGFFNVLAAPIVKVITWLDAAHTYDNALVMDCVSVLLSRYVGWAILCVLYYIALRLVAMLIMRIGNLMRRNAVLNSTDRLFGILVGGVKGVLFSTVALFLLGCCSGLSFMAPYFDDLEGSVISKPITHLATGFITRYIDVESMTGGLLKPQNPDETVPEEPAPTVASLSSQALGSPGWATRPSVFSL